MTAGQAGNLDRDGWIALASTPGVGDATFERLLAAFGGARETLDAVARWSAGSADRRLARTLGARLRTGLADGIRASAHDPMRVQREMAALGGWLLMPLDPDYPPRLLELETPPLVIYGIGRREALDRGRVVAVVGTRRPTPWARDLAHRIGVRLVEVGATVVSGLAVGIDGAAHQAVLEAGGETVAVVGGGLDEPGPSAHRGMARTIVGSGAVIAELAPGVRPTPGTFPRRNRIVSALSDTTIVVEAPARSGALITARHALEQGKLLLVAPGRPFDRRIAGNLALLRETPAVPLVGLDEMVADLGFDREEKESPERRQLASSIPVEVALAMLGPNEQAVARALSGGPQTVDGLCRLTALGPGVVSAALTILQLRGWARVLGTMQLPSGPLLGAVEP